MMQVNKTSSKLNIITCLDFYSPSGIIKITKTRRAVIWAANVARMRAKIRVKFLVEKPKRKRPLARPSWKDNIKMNLE
jgi:hypothetical protein